MTAPISPAVLPPDRSADQDQEVLVTRCAGWSVPENRPAMANDVDRHARVGLTSRHLLRDGAPWIPVSGEIHYSRVPRARWRERLALLRSGGVDVVSTYAVWIHHEPVRGEPSFAGDLDVAAFVRLCGELGLHVVLRVGPWVHGEVRNGGFPDWVQRAPVAHRTDDPAYLDLFRGWFEALGAQVGPLCGPESPVIGIQLENELPDQPAHLATLKAMARAAGLSAPLWTATAWGGADLPAGEVLPLYSGYGDGFWVEASAPWDATFRAHYLFSHVWDDPGVGADVRGTAASEVQVRDRDETFPPATCELGGGMATTYHRRLVPTGADIAAVAHTKLGSGSMWQGYYMYAGGLNPRAGGPVQESHATGYPNDLPVFDYDFHAAVGAAGTLAESHAALRRQHAVLAAFGDRLAGMGSHLPDVVPHGVEDTSTLRWAVRSDGRSAFVLVAWHQPHVPLPTLRGVRLAVELAHGRVEIGHDGLDVPPGTLACWPVGLPLGPHDGATLEAASTLRWATASVLTTLPDGTLVLVAEHGLDADLALPPGAVVSGDTVVPGDGEHLAPGVHRVPGRTGGVVHVEHEGRSARVVVVGAQDAGRVWVLDGPRGRELLLADDPTWVDDGGLVVRAATRPRVLRYDHGWQPLALAPDADPGRSRTVRTTLESTWTPPPASYGSHAGRASAPGQDVLDEHGSVHRLHAVGEPAAAVRRTLRVEWAGDVAQLLVDDEVVADRFWDGTPWDVDLDVLDGARGDRLSLRVLALDPGAEVWLPADAADRRRSVAGPLHALDAVTLERTVCWRAPLTGGAEG
ncbi:beta-galactosidase [Oerskovia flava]|uniref:beta-galactosidase n=1 Tax=Oerskovia flava TaxID=2986422 RepID=UPI00223EC4F9|nr:beta-galactosidase [Oerskovia sp. JB1-3-2]